MKKSVFIVAIVLITGLLFAGCAADSAETTEPIWEAVAPAETTEPMETIVPVETEPVEATTPTSPFANDANASVEYYFPLTNSVEVKVGDNTHVLCADENEAYLYPAMDSVPPCLTTEFVNASFEYYLWSIETTMELKVLSEHKVSYMELYIPDRTLGTDSATLESALEQNWATDIMMARVEYTTPTSTITIPQFLYDSNDECYRVSVVNIVFENGDIIHALDTSWGE